MIRLAQYSGMAAGLAVAILLVFFGFQKKEPSIEDHAIFPSSPLIQHSSPSAFFPEQEKTPDSLSISSLMPDIIAQVRNWMVESNPDKKVQEEQQLEALLTNENAVEIAKALPDDLLIHTAFGSAALQRWSMVNPQAVADWLITNPATTNVQRDIAVASWLHQDVTKLNGYLANLPAGAEKQDFLIVLSNRALTEKDPVEAITALEQLDDITLRNQELGWAVTTWSINDPQTARNWTLSIPDASLRQEMMAWSAVGSAHQDPSQAAQWLTQNVLPSATKDAAMQSIASIWAQTGPQARLAAVNWVNQLPVGASRDGALQAIVQIWNNDDPSGFEAWMQGLPKTPLHADAEAALARINATAEIPPASGNTN